MDDRRWSWNIGRLAGIKVYIHATFVVLLAWIAIGYMLAGETAITAVRGLVLVISVFAVVVLHELGHALVARRFGIPTRDITLYPIGGVSRLERMPERPREELLVAIAGPLVNGAIALALYLGLLISGATISGNPLYIGTSFAVQLMWINVSLGVFNLVPAFPMDGGRVLRALLSFRMPRVHATVLAAKVGRAIAVVFAVIGLMWSPILALIGVFVWVVAGHEAAAEELRAALRGLSVGDAMVGKFQTLDPDAPLAEAADALEHGFQHDFPVVLDGRLVGLLTRDDLVRGLAQYRDDTPVRAVMHHQFGIASSGEDLEAVLSRVQNEEAFVVVRDDRPVGLLDPAHVGDVLAIHRSVA